MSTDTTAAQRRVEELIAVYAGPNASVAELLCDRHDADAVAFTIVEADRTVHRLTYGELQAKSRRFAAALADLGVQRGDRVATLMGKSEELVVALVGIWRLGAIHVPLFTAFASPAIAFRLQSSDVKVVITDADQRHKLEPGPDMPADAPWSTIVTGPGKTADGALQFATFLQCARPGDPRANAVAVGGDGEFARLFTSGTTGTPKGVPITARAIASFVTYLEFGLDVREDDVFWNAADPGWGYGLYYGIIAPLAAGRPNILLHAGFSAELTYWVMSNLGVTNFAAAPTVYRVLRSDGAPIPDDLLLRRCSSAGEPLNPEVVAWSERVLGVPAHDTYGQTEHGMCIINGWHPHVARELRPGSMGHPMPGWAVEVLKQDRDEIAEPGEMGRVVIDIDASPLIWFTHYVGLEDKTAERYSRDGRWYYTGDAGSRDDDGYFYFAGRDDDVIIMAGYRIGPTEVENVLVSHPGVVESVVVGVPEELRGEVLEAFVVLRRDVAPSDDLARELQQLVKTNYAAHAFPRTVHFVAELPKTPSGKVERFKLRQRRRAEVAEAAR